MNEEKKLNEQELDKVSGGSYDMFNFVTEFTRNNCVFCTKKRLDDCPYHGDAQAKYDAVGGDPSATCPERGSVSGIRI